MTSGASDIPIRSFQDVIDQKYKIVVIPSSSQHNLMKSALPGSPMHKVYYESMDGNSDAFMGFFEWLKKVKDGKTLIFIASSASHLDDRVYALKMVDSVTCQLGWAFQKNSEFTEFFNYHLFKLIEGGLMYHVRKSTLEKEVIEIGLSDTITLGYENVMFPFLLLVGGTVFALLQLSLEVLRRFW
jgi:hypothetical protein